MHSTASRWKKGRVRSNNRLGGITRIKAWEPGAAISPGMAQAKQLLAILGARPATGRLHFALFMAGGRCVLGEYCGRPAWRSAGGWGPGCLARGRRVDYPAGSCGFVSTRLFVPRKGPEMMINAGWRRPSTRQATPSTRSQASMPITPSPSCSSALAICARRASTADWLI